MHIGSTDIMTCHLKRYDLAYFDQRNGISWATIRHFVTLEMPSFATIYYSDSYKRRIFYHFSLSKDVYKYTIEE